MPTTKRLMTDETGQDIASAIEDLAIAVKPDATEIPMASDSNTTVAESITNLQDGIAIIADGNTHASATSGQFIFVKNHDISAGFTGNAALATGLYTASAAIGTNADLTTANLTADPNGGFNALQGQIDALNSNLAILESRLFTEVKNGTVIPCNGYGAVIIGGLLGNYANILFAIFVYGGTITIKNLFDGSTWSATDSFNASWSSNKLTITCNSGSSFTALVLV